MSKPPETSHLRIPTLNAMNFGQVVVNVGLACLNMTSEWPGQYSTGLCAREVGFRGLSRPTLDKLPTLSWAMLFCAM